MRDDPFLNRMRSLAGLDDVHVGALFDLYGARRRVAARTDLAAAGAATERLHVVLEGWACRYRLSRQGQRHVTHLLLPGDVCDMDALHFRRRDSSVGTLTPCEIVTLDRGALRELASRARPIGDALGWLGAVENCMLSERQASLAVLSARERLAHLLCELHARLAIIGRAERDTFQLPLTQGDLAETLGLTSVHVNRMVRELRDGGLVDVRGREVGVCDWKALRREAGFRSDYLHLEGVDGEGHAGKAVPAMPATEPGRVSIGHRK